MQGSIRKRGRKMGRDSGRWALSTEQPQGKTSFVLRLFVILVKQVSRLAVHFNSKVLVIKD